MKKEIGGAKGDFVLLVKHVNQLFNTDTRSRDLGFEAYGAAAKTYLLSEIVGK